MPKICGAVVMSLILTPMAASAQDAAAPGRHAAVSLRESAIREASRFDLARGGAAQQQAKPRSWVGRRPILAGTLIGGGIGVGTGAVMVGGSECQGDIPCWWAPAGLGALGAGVGAATGLVVSLLRR